MRGPMLTRLWFPLGQVLFGLWLFNALPVKAPAWLTDGPANDPSIAEPEIVRALFLVMLILISMGPFMWVDTARLRRRAPLLDLPAMLRLVLSSRRGVLTLVVLALFLGQTAWCVMGGGVPMDSLFVRINVAVTCGVLMIVLLPPTAIVLASSAPSTGSGRLLDITAKSLFPFRVVSLLDGKRLSSAMFASRLDNLRTIGRQGWRQSVHCLVDITRLVIVDARSSTPPVCEEILYMLHPERVRKAIFVIADDGSAPGLEAVGVGLKRPLHIRCCTEAEIPREIARFRTYGELRP